MEQKTKQSTCVTSSNLKRDLNSRGSPPSGHLGSDSLATSKAVIHYRARSNPFSLPQAKQKTARWAVFVLFGCGGSGARRNDRTVVNKVPFGTLEPYGDRARRREGFEPHVLAFSLRRKCCGQFGGSDLPPAGHSLPPHPPSYSPFGLITLSLCVHTLSHAKQKHMCNKLKFEKGFEFSRLAAARSGSALTAVQGCHSLPSPFKSLFFTASKAKNSPMGCFCFVWLRRWDLNLTTSGL